MKRFLIASSLALTLIFGGCGMGSQQELKTSVPREQMTSVQQAQDKVNQANILLTALNQTITQQVNAGLLSKVTAQSYLSRSKTVGANLDKIQAAIRTGSGDFGDPGTQLLLIQQLQIELNKALQK